MEIITEKVQKGILDILADHPEHFLIEIKVKPTNNIKVFIDGDKGVGIDDLVKYNRALYKQLEEENLFPDGDFSLEVSSPGLGEPLKMHRQYLKNVGRFVEVITADGQKTEGKLLAVSDEGIVVEETKGKARPNDSSGRTRQNDSPGRTKKAEIIKHDILFSDIKSTQIQIKF